MHEQIVSVYSSVLAEDFATANKLQPTTDQQDAYAVTNNWTSDSIAGALVNCGRGPEALCHGGGRAMKEAPPSQPTPYPWGHAESELERIISTGRYLGDLTEHVLRLAGIDRGMRVLDVGCGPGDVTFLAAKLVGFEGTVIGV